MNASEIASFIWSIAELLRGDYKQSEYGKVILPFTVLRRLDCVLEPTKAAVVAEHQAMKDSGMPMEQFLLDKSGMSFFNSSPMDMGKLLNDPANLRANVISYLEGFSENVRDIFEKFEFDKQVLKLDSANLLFLVVQKFASVDLHPSNVSNAAMGHMFEELIRKFAELSNETAGEHFTPREVIRLMVNLLFINDGSGLTDAGAVRTLYDPTAGTGGMLSVGEEHLVAMNPNAKLALFGQELNPESFAICKADMLVKGQDVGNIILGNTLSQDGHSARKFDYMLSNPPFGVEWKKVEDAIRKEHETKGFNGRFGPGLPRVSDGSLLFLLHLVSKMRDPAKGGSRIGIVLNGSPLFTGGAGSGESEIRKYLFENDLVEAIIALPNDMFYNTGIGTYVWILSNHKPPERKGKVQLVDGSALWVKMRKSLGSKRKELSVQDVADITKLYGDFAPASLATVFDAAGKEISHAILNEGQQAPAAPKDGKVEIAPISKIFKNSDFGYTTITVERPLKLRFESNEVSQARLKEAATGGKKAPAKEDVEGVEKLLKALTAKGAMFKRKDAEAAAVAASKAEAVELNAWMGKTLWSCIEHRDPNGEVQTKGKGKIEPDSELRDTENVPLAEDIQAYFDREVKPHAPDAWIDETKSKVGYEVPFNRHFYVFKPPRDLAAIDKDLKAVTANIIKMLGGLSA
ncbi:type I restriction-modification system subunit M [Acidovorax soli]|uniref:site-specific DNA-methyltransferase (adenine-specific) n=1 Tax=Acidovorax soli TaxID=592050 RepID=A0A1H4EXK5_9BURK|nr:class I SAM-dependent DNA methyltransferase [Acidovorax soli]SEA89793.1 type I restriction enzyme M protein [Acidovorax soli]